MTTHPEGSFEAVWPDLQKRIQRFLGSKKVPDSARDDVVQETGLRLYRMWDQVDPAGSPVGLALTIAMNIVRDNARRDSHRTVVEIEPDVPAVCDVERSGLARLELSRVRRALGELTPAQRSVLLSELDRNEAPPAASPAAIKMLRMRARRNLSAILERAGCGILVARWRRLLGLPQEMLLGRDLTKVEQGLASSLAGVVAAAAITLSPLALLGVDGGEPTTRSRTSRVASQDTVWLSDADITLASASPTPTEAVSAPRASNLDGESTLVRHAAASGMRKASTGGKGRTDDHSATVEVPLPGGEGEIEGDGGVDVDVEPPTLDPGGDNPMCDPMAPGCAPSPGDRPGSAHASVKVRVRNTTVAVTVDTENIANSVDEVSDL
jgi:hypothetical protein